MKTVLPPRQNSAALARRSATATLFEGVVTSIMKDDAVPEVEQPEARRPFPSRGFYFGLLALSVVGLWALGGAFSPLTIVLSLLVVYAAGVLRILREHSKTLDDLGANRDRVHSGETFKLSGKLARYSALFVLPSVILIILAAGIVIFLFANSSSG